VIAPWLVHSTTLFGGPFWSQPFQRTLAGGSRQVEYLLVDGEAVKRNLPTSGNRVAALRERAIDLYGNVGFVAKQLLVLTPVLGGLFVVGLLLLVNRPLPTLPWDPSNHPTMGPLDPHGPTAPRPGVAPSPQPRGEPPFEGEGGPSLTPTLSQRESGLCCDPVPVAVLALVHLALIVWWPTTKFRYLVPLLPLVFAVGAWALWQVQPGGLRLRLGIVTLGLCLFTNAWSMLSIPSRTYYYDGGLVGDNFGQQGERLFVEEADSFRAAADAIVAHGPGVVLGDHILAPFTRLPLVVNSTGYPPEIVEHLARRYSIRYVVIDHTHAGLYDFLRPTPIWSNERHVVLEIPSR
jgi:hypothetical protein